MPELPEVETLCRQLRKTIPGRTILKDEVYDSKLSRFKEVRGAKVLDVRRRGKTIAIELDSGRTILIHLRMTGRLLWRTTSEKPQYARWKLALDGGNIFLVDPRRFATVQVAAECPKTAEREIFGDLDIKKFIELHGRRKTRIKSLLMDQKAISGIGNIYACEILHRAGIHPEREAGALTGSDWEKILQTTKTVLKKAIANRGTSISDWRDLYGRKGDNQHELTVYGKEGVACPFCGVSIRRIRQSNRGTYFCPRCQK
ncbi:MAG TPA: bifunctional DNA-formamidopyrimidine glycosylase/DNA-(apurinic or apyrimidinic site) lyase [Deltaproteobacteria bacterium]|nr:bifunctional DNA-formamidopyrimidine glycosylase/DNA-(apurinic or apyrimidinic site) lyase [Deltaproteobacteria bacterium]